MRLGIGHAKADRNLVQEQDLSVRLATFAQVVASEEDQLVGAGFELVRGQDRRIGAAVGIGDRLGDLLVGIAADAVQRDLDALRRAAPGGVQNMGREISGHLDLAPVSGPNGASFCTLAVVFLLGQSQELDKGGLPEGCLSFFLKNRRYFLV